MKTKFTLLIGLLLSINALFANGYSETSTTIKISSVEDKTLSDINKIADKQEKTVYLEKTITQDEFDKICSKLSWITKLRIDYDNSNISDLTSLKGLSKLTSLDVRNLIASHSSPIDLLIITKTTTLTELYFINTNVTNTEALNTLVNLEKIDFTNSGLTNLDFLDFMPNVSELVLDGSNHTFENYNKLTQLKKLKDLSVRENKQATDANMAIIKGNTGLKSINISKCIGITNLNFLANAKSLKEINAEGCSNLTNTNAINSALKLKSLDFEGTGITSINFTTDKTYIRDLNISHTGVTDLSPLSGCTGIVILDISNTDISSLQNLSGLDKLKTLDISNTNISSIQGITKLPNIKEININNTDISNLDEFSAMTQIQEIVFIESKINDIKPIYNTENLKYIAIPKDIPQTQIEAIKVRFPNIRIDVGE